MYEGVGIEFAFSLCGVGFLLIIQWKTSGYLERAGARKGLWLGLSST
jgi:hypothetical protein